MIASVSSGERNRLREIGFVQESAGNEPSYLSDFIAHCSLTVAVGFFFPDFLIAMGEIKLYPKMI